MERGGTNNMRDRVTNKEVLGRVGEPRKLLDIIRRKKKKWMGHMLRHPELVKEIAEGTWREREEEEGEESGC